MGSSLHHQLLFFPRAVPRFGSSLPIPASSTYKERDHVQWLNPSTSRLFNCTFHRNLPHGSHVCSNCNFSRASGNPPREELSPFYLRGFVVAFRKVILKFRVLLGTRKLQSPFARWVLGFRVVRKVPDAQDDVCRRRTCSLGGNFSLPSPQRAFPAVLQSWALKVPGEERKILEKE